MLTMDAALKAFDHKTVIEMANRTNVPLDDMKEKVRLDFDMRRQWSIFLVGIDIRRLCNFIRGGRI